MIYITPKFSVTHLNIRTSISILLLKLFIVEIASVILVIFFHSFILYLLSGIFFLQLFNIPIFLILVFMKTIISISIILQWLNEYYEISAKTIFHRKGLFFKTEEKYHLENVTYIEVMQGVLGKYFNFGSIQLFDKRKNSILVMYMIHNPLRYASVIEDLVPKLSEKKVLVREHIIEENPYDL